ncbi:helix-turn-helix domain-containing protein [Paenibacillus terricola]|uniref:helix-turn-helix domain-containing protein n=1 Tax=Paenibacillus terricola TaxID=2763503 RepID=UPI002963FDE2|nr:helix-turn-helix domain-containing protein [Paenibacillus terricola]
MIADQCGVNKHYFCRLFQKSEHTSPLAYLRNRRVEAALSLLRTTNCPCTRSGSSAASTVPAISAKYSERT